MDASKLGTIVKDGKNQKTVLSKEDESFIIDTFNNLEPKDDFSVVVPYDDIEEKKYSFSAGQYFDIKIEYVDISEEEFEEKMNQFKNNIGQLFNDSKEIESKIKKQLERLKYV